MTRSQDEVVTEYGLLAEGVGSSRRFLLGDLPPAEGGALARWQAGDAGGCDLLDRYVEEDSPLYGSYYRHVVKAEKSGERDIKFTFDGPGNRELPTIVGEVPVLPKHWWEGCRQQGRKRDVSATTLEPPLGSGPYRIKEFVAAPLGHPRAREGLLGCKGAGAVGRTISTSCASSTSATIWSRWKRSRRTRRTGIAENSRQAMGDRLRLSRRSSTSACQEEFPDRQLRPHAGLRRSICVATSSGCAAASGVQLTPMISRR